MKVLIVDDERNIRESLKKYLNLEQIDSTAAETGESALRCLEREAFDAVILDLKLPGMSGQEVLAWIQSRGILSPVIMISAHGQIADAVTALKSGARDYLVKPFDPAELIIKLRQLVENKRRENRQETEDRAGAGENSLIGNSPAMRELSAQIDKIAVSDVTVLITGESGSGKEVAAREIHRRSGYAPEPFAAVNIGGIHEGLMESELFGHEKGAFTGAAARKQGLFELAGRGTLFLDEVGEMPMPLQVKLLRVLQERKIRRLGGNDDIPVNARIISATNRDIETLVRENHFREDLYYRLNVFRLTIPPLREHPEDILLLAEYLLKKLSSRMGRHLPALSQGATEKLRGYPFPGNVRELENILERALIYGEGGTITPKDIDLRRPGRGPVHTAETDDTGVPAPQGDPGDSEIRINSHNGNETENGVSSLESVEREAIRNALASTEGNRTRAASLLGISRKTIINKIKAYKLE
ncbi:sigma-54 dependent transcriptional regulator/response regulator [Treponema primitia ZAS-2]|uniref:Sigma-54 dependent transcriptional regulator/response regulator n=1 Tax=Treponema primitia (strain ATCC BAA-887 / DSM 12427 / ZAS-2) TaxID=545694 RepID=F5YMG0_TREPZ|nr:sigma-54 dependent transcriptional regulator [Treponema primitia]AEF86054.1 sigma-54 dependent transcriptional regulator/response regulator [Treponema primitia ZAS-2]